MIICGVDFPPPFCLMDELGIINILVMSYKNTGLKYIIQQLVGKLFSGDMNSPQSEDRISQA